jgi:DNA helicase II / ATP-dependent DNA helicase PcrA
VPTHTPTPSQRAAIEAAPQPLLVIAGPGSGKTFCLIERIRFLIERHGVAPERICAFTFTNKAAEEIATRLDQLGPKAALVRRSTLHKFCVDTLRELGPKVGVEQGFGIADDDYQLSVMWRLEANPKKHKKLIEAFTLHRLRGDDLHVGTAKKYERYLEILKGHNLLDFDMLVLKTAELLKLDDVAPIIRSRYDCILVDEFQDLNRVQYRVIRELARDHKHVFAVGDHDQSIYGWAGADNEVFKEFMNDFGEPGRPIVPIVLQHNFRCSRQVADVARAFVNANTPLFGQRTETVAERNSAFGVAAVAFDDHDQEIHWIVQDIVAQRRDHALSWGDFALLYRKHEIGDVSEPGLLNAGIPCRLAHGRAIAEDPTVAYVAAALRVIANPLDDIHKEAFLGLVLPRTLMHEIKAEAEARSASPIDRLRLRWKDKDESGRKIRRGLYALKNFRALAHRHTSLGALIEELLSRRVGEYKTPLERSADQLRDPETLDDAKALAFRLNGIIKHDRPVSVPAMGGAEIPTKAMLHALGVRTVILERNTPNAQRPTPNVVERISTSDAKDIGLPLAVFKAGQILASRQYDETFKDFTVVDIETTGKDGRSCEIVEIAAVRVRGGKPVAEFVQRVKPRVAIEPGAYATHHISAEDLVNEPHFEQVWPKFRDFCGRDVLVAHNGFQFDFPVIARMSRGLPDSKELATYDTLPLAKEIEPASRRLQDLAAKYGIETGKAHSALDDARTLARVFSRLCEKRLAVARKASLTHLLDHLGVALALSGDHNEGSEEHLLLNLCRPYSLGAFSECRDYYQMLREEAGDPSLPTIETVIDKLGGAQRMAQIQAQKSADERYPVAMMRIRRLLEGIDELQTPRDARGDTHGVIPSEARNLQSQIQRFLERVALSTKDGATADHDRVNLLTLHSTKGLEFSRVYIIGVEDAQFLGERVSKEELEESRRVLYVGMTRAKERLVLTRVEQRGGRPTGGAQFLDEMALTPLRQAVEQLSHAAAKAGHA